MLGELGTRPQPLDTEDPDSAARCPRQHPIPATSRAMEAAKKLAGEPAGRHKRHTEAKRGTESCERWNWRR